MTELFKSTSCPRRYRPDVDGLRAIAILPVILFHANLGCPGGFVGVDVFFVISGFVISSLIFQELDAGTFSLVAFWERRIRRIIPALMLMVVTTLIAGWFLFLPEDYEKLCKSVVAQATLSSNFFFYQEWLHGKGYFAPPVDPKPLLHTWSLAVEEQFYLLFPLLLILVARWQKRRISETLLVLAIGSFVLSVYGSYHFSAAAFYLLPSRACELLLGALLPLMHERITIRQRVREISGWVGLSLIVYAIFFYNVYTVFPGRAAIPPCLGAALIIFSSESKLSNIGRILALKPFVFIGLISYSLHLWHWPLLVFSRYPMGSESWKASVLMLAITAALALFSWKYVEAPFRKQRIFPKRSRLFWFAGIATANVFVFGLIVVKEQGFPNRYSGKASLYVDSREHIAFRNDVTLADALVGRFPELGSQPTNQPVKLLVWGDSHAMAIAPVLDELCRRYSWRGVEATHSATAPIMNYDNVPEDAFGNNWPAFPKAVLDYITKKQVKNVVIAGYWRHYTVEDKQWTNLVQTVRAVIDLGAKVYVLKDVPTQADQLPERVAFAVLHNGDLEDIGITPEQYQSDNRDFDLIFDQISQEGATVLAPADYFRNSKGLYPYFPNKLHKLMLLTYNKAA
jgi:peptidoglycan/LPS O-acetylase OafA/YrhL